MPKRVPWIVRRSNQSILKKINLNIPGRTDTEAEAPILWPPDVKSWLIGKDPDAGKIEGRRRRGRQRMKWLDGITNLMGMSLSKLQETLNSWTWLSDWTATACQRNSNNHAGLEQWPSSWVFHFEEKHH